MVIRITNINKQQIVSKTPNRAICCIHCEATFIMFRKPYLEYKKEATDRGVVCVTVYANRKTFFEIECFENSPYTIEEEIQNWLSDNGYDDVDYDLFNVA